jgi:hypothetical protein
MIPPLEAGASMTPALLNAAILAGFFIVEPAASFVLMDCISHHRPRWCRHNSIVI